MNPRIHRNGLSPISSDLFAPICLESAAGKTENCENWDSFLFRMGSKHVRTDINYAYPTAEIAVMDQNPYLWSTTADRTSKRLFGVAAASRCDGRKGR